jgi:hypothetical protein
VLARVPKPFVHELVRHMSGSAELTGLRVSSETVNNRPAPMITNIVPIVMITMVRSAVTAPTKKPDVMLSAPMIATAR